MFKKVLLVLASGAMVLAACGGDDGGGAAGAETTTTAAAASSGTRAELADRLLVPGDLDTGDALDARWAEGDVSDGVDIELPECVDQDRFDTRDTAVVKLVTESSLKLPALEEHLTRHPDAGAAEDAMNAAATRLDGCRPVFRFEGTPSTGTTGRLEVPALGDSALAWRTTVEIAGTQVAITNVYVEVGPVVAAFVHVTAGAPDDAVLTTQLQKAVAKLA